MVFAFALLFFTSPPFAPFGKNDGAVKFERTRPFFILSFFSLFLLYSDTSFLSYCLLLPVPLSLFLAMSSSPSPAGREPSLERALVVHESFPLPPLAPPPPPHFESLPIDVLHLVAGHLESARDLCSFEAVCRSSR